MTMAVPRQCEIWEHCSISDYALASNFYGYNRFRWPSEEVLSKFINRGTDSRPASCCSYRWWDGIIHGI